MIPRECSFPDARWTALARQWHPLAPSSQAADRPLGAVLLDMRVVAWRSGILVSAAKDICIHRGAQLSPGTIKDGELVCPYHGFRYAPSGACTLAPCTGSPLTPLPEKLHLRMFGAAERGGLVWVRILPGGPDLPPDLPGAPGTVAALDLGTSAQRAVEGVIDLGRNVRGAQERLRASLAGPYCGAVRLGGSTEPSAVFAVQPLSRARCRIHLSGGAADEVCRRIEGARAVLESLPIEGDNGAEALLHEDGPVVDYRGLLAAAGLA